jgi:hypothetical protein
MDNPGAYHLPRRPIDGRAKRIVRGFVIIIGLLSLLSYIAPF